MLLNKCFYKFCLNRNDDFFYFLYSKRTKVLDTLKNRKTNSIVIHTSTNNSAEEANSKVFTEEAINNFFPAIMTVTIDLFDNYTQTMRTGEAIVKQNL